MKKGIIVAAVAALLASTTAFAAPAQARWYGGWGYGPSVGWGLGGLGVGLGLGALGASLGTGYYGTGYGYGPYYSGYSGYVNPYINTYPNYTGYYGDYWY